MARPCERDNFTRQRKDHERSRRTKRKMADGGCLGFRRRGRTRQAAKMREELQAGLDTRVSEWGNPAGRRPATGYKPGRTRGTETSQYPQEEKEKIDGPSSGERKGRSPNRVCRGTCGVVGLRREYRFREPERHGNAGRRG